MGTRRDAPFWKRLFLCREGLKIDPERHDPSLAWFLHTYAEVLHCLQLSEQTCEVDKECIALRKQLYKEDPALYRTELIQSINNHATHLRSVGLIEEAHAKKSIPLIHHLNHFLLTPRGRVTNHHQDFTISPVSANLIRSLDIPQTVTRLPYTLVRTNILYTVPES
jgi:hypothetical protein